MRKEYAIKGIVERFISVPLGKGSITIHFEGGAIDGAVLPHRDIVPDGPPGIVPDGEEELAACKHGFNVHEYPTI